MSNLTVHNPGCNITVSTVVTDYAWAETSRPIVTINEDLKSAYIQIGSSDRSPSFELLADCPENLRGDLEGLADIFRKAADFVRSKL